MCRIDVISHQGCLWIFGETYAFVCATVNINSVYGNSFLGKFEHVLFFQKINPLS